METDMKEAVNPLTAVRKLFIMYIMSELFNEAKYARVAVTLRNPIAEPRRWIMPMMSQGRIHLLFLSTKPFNRRALMGSLMTVITKVAIH